MARSKKAKRKVLIEMELQGKIKGFAGYPPQWMEQMKKDLKLSMSAQQLLLCASYYRAYEKRDPFIAEMQMIDRLIAEQAFSPSWFAPSELLTNHSFAAQTFADLMEKRRVLAPNATAPCTLSEAFCTADAYLTRAGKKRQLPHCTVLLEETKKGRDQKAEGHTVSVSESSDLLRLLPVQKTPKEIGDLFVLLLPFANARKTDVGAELAELLRDSAIASAVKEVKPVQKGGLLTTLLTLANSLWIEPARLATVGEPIPLSMLSGMFEDELLIRISQNQYHEFYKAAKTHNLRAAAFASVTSDSKYSFAQEKALWFSVESNFLRSLILVRGIKAQLPNEQKEADATIRHIPILAPTHHTGDPTTLPFDAPEVIKVEEPGIAVAAAACKPQADFFHNALDTLLAPVLSLALSGCDYSNQRLSIALQLPTDHTSPDIAGESVSAILGLYRGQTELAIPTAASSISASDRLTHPEWTVYAISPDADPCPITYVCEGNRVYCLAPETDENGIPIFESLRGLLDFVADLRRQGILQSARVLCREAVTDAIREMSRGVLCCRITGDALFVEGALPLAVMIETNVPIRAKQVGIVAQKSNPTKIH